MSGRDSKEWAESGPVFPPCPRSHSGPGARSCPAPSLVAEQTGQGSSEFYPCGPTRGLLCSRPLASALVPGLGWLGGPKARVTAVSYIPRSPVTPMGSLSMDPWESAETQRGPWAISHTRGPGSGPQGTAIPACPGGWWF